MGCAYVEVRGALMQLYRECEELTESAARRRTLGQMVVFWATFLGLVPAGIVALTDRLGLARWAAAPYRSWAWALFAAASALGVWSALAMASQGRGTPLPTSCAPRLVTRGPYRFVRNPMAVAGIAQGVAVGLVLRAPAVVTYSLAGAVIWHFCVRPSEERDLARRFGATYDDYRSRTPLWVPRLGAPTK